MLSLRFFGKRPLGPGKTRKNRGFRLKSYPTLVKHGLGHPAGLGSRHSQRSEESPAVRANEILRFAQNDDIPGRRT